MHVLFAEGFADRGYLAGYTDVPDELERHLDCALADAGLCASDPLCAEHEPGPDGVTLHAAACHACLFAPETSCERGNRYLDRAVLAELVSGMAIAFFPTVGEG